MDRLHPKLFLLLVVVFSLAGAALVPVAAAVSPTLTGTITADKAVYKQGDTVTLSYSVGGTVPHGGQPAIYLACYFNGGYDYAYWNVTDYPTVPLGSVGEPLKRDGHLAGRHPLLTPRDC